MQQLRPEHWKLALTLLAFFAASATTAFAHEHLPETDGVGPWYLTVSYFSTRRYAPIRPLITPPDHAMLLAHGASSGRRATQMISTGRQADGADMPAPSPTGPLITRTASLLAEWESTPDLFLRLVAAYSQDSGASDPTFGGEYDYNLDPRTDSIFVITASVPLAKNRVPGQSKVTTLTASVGAEHDWQHFGIEGSIVSIRTLTDHPTPVLGVDATSVVLEADAYLYQWKLFTTLAYVYPNSSTLQNVRPAVSLGLAYLFD